MSSGDMPFKIPIVGPCARTGSGSTVRVENDAAHSTSDSIGNLLDDLAEGSRADLSPGWLWVHSDFMGGWAARMLPGAARPFSQLLLVLIGFCVGRFSCVCGTQPGSTLVHPAAEVVADLYRPPPSLGAEVLSRRSGGTRGHSQPADPCSAGRRRGATRAGLQHRGAQAARWRDPVAGA